MTTEHLVDVELRSMAVDLPSFDPSLVPIEQIRALADMRTDPDRTRDPRVELGEQWIDRAAPDGPVRVLVYRPRDAQGTLPAFLHIHGGGYVMGRPEQVDARNEALALNAQCVVVSVDYRLAPETPAPGGLYDCMLALRWLAASCETLGIDPSRIAIGGESAGGGLAAALALLARDEGDVKPIFQWLIYPMIDDRTACRDAFPNTGQFVWTHSANRYCWQAMLGHEPGLDTTSPYAAAARAQDLSGLPPAYIAVGALDLFVDEDIEHSRRLMAAGVPVELRVYPGAFHGFDSIAESRVGTRFRDDATEALRRALHG